MKIKLILTILTFFALSGLVSALCTDSDGGVDIYEGGTIEFSNPNAVSPFNVPTYTQEYCNNNIMYENFCENENSIGTQEIECPQGYICYFSACVEEGSSAQNNGVGNNATNQSTSSGGGSGTGGSCPQYYTCPGGTQVSYCSMVNVYNPGTCVNSTNGQGPICSGGNGTFGCQCNPNPASLCPLTQPNGSSGGSGPNIANSSGTGGGVSNNTNATASTGENGKYSVLQKLVNWIKGLFGKGSVDLGPSSKDAQKTAESVVGNTEFRGLIENSKFDKEMYEGVYGNED